ncbi:MAG TPA: glucose-1-phosphate adenylyltransferase, partial [Gemmataceae bacterium]|nr:glucose-1-phosphate adenylyltransferase [Gemmataceae bacterium]
TIIIGSDKYETAAQKEENRRTGRPNLNIGDGAVIQNAILDKDCRIGRGVKLINEKGEMEADGPNGMYHIRDGIIVVPRGTVIPEGTVV